MLMLTDPQVRPQYGGCWSIFSKVNHAALMLNHDTVKLQVRTSAGKIGFKKNLKYQIFNKKLGSLSCDQDGFWAGNTGL